MPKIRELNISLGLSIDRKGLWVKPALGMRIELEGKDQDPEMREVVIKRGFEMVQEALEKELERICGEDE
jgi:hypothetical protein